MIKISKILSIGLDVVRDIILAKVDERYLTLDNTLSVLSYNEDLRCIYTGFEESLPIFAVELSSKTNMSIPFSDFPKVVSNHSYEDADINLIYTKSPLTIEDGTSKMNGEVNDFATKQSIYLVTNIEEIAKSVASFYQKELLKVKEIYLMIFELGLQAEYRNDPAKLTRISELDYLEFKEVPLDILAINFKKLFGEGIYKATDLRSNILGNDPKNHFQLYQGKGISSRLGDDENSPDLLALFATPWLGYIAFKFVISQKNILMDIVSKTNAVKNFNKENEVISTFKMFLAEYEDNKNDYILMNTVALINNPNAITKIGNILGMKFIKKTFFSKSIVYRTPLKSYDLDYFYIVKISDAQKYIKSIHKDINVEVQGNIDLAGKDLGGNYITYSFSEPTSPNAVLLAPSGSGKSYFIQQMIAQKMGIKWMKNLDKEDPLKVIIESADKNIDFNVRYYDIGSSAEKLVKAIDRKFPKTTTFLTDNLTNLRFGITDIPYNHRTKKLDKEAFSFSMQIINVIIEVSGEIPLGASEIAEIESALNYVYANNTMTGVSIRDLEKLGGYEKVIDEIYDYYDKHNLDNLNGFELTKDLDKLPTRFDFIKRPLFSDIIKILELTRGKTGIEEETKKTISSALKKIDFLKKDETFGYFNSDNVSTGDFFYMELETIKSLKDKFLPIFSFIFLRTYKQDVKRARKIRQNNGLPPQVMYLLEESANYAKVPALMEVFKTILKESRKNNIQLIFISQKGEELVTLVDLVDTSIILPGDDTVKQEKDLKFTWSRKGVSEKDFINSRKMTFFRKYRKKYYAFIDSGEDTLISMKLKISELADYIFFASPYKNKVIEKDKKEDIEYIGYKENQNDQE